MTELKESLAPTPIDEDCDLCVVGGSCTGVFAAVRAARLGLKVAIIEANGFFGGVATAAQVNIWHSQYNTEATHKIWEGLTAEMIERLRKLNAVAEKHDCPSAAFKLNTEELKIELDSIVREHNIRPFLHARFVAPIMNGDDLVAIAIEDKNGRRAIKAKYFVDASGDGDLIFRMNLPTREDTQLQPPTMCVRLTGWSETRRNDPNFDIKKVVFNPENPHAIKPGFLWGAEVPGTHGKIDMLAGTRVFGTDVSDADQLTNAEMEGRRQVRKICDALRHDGYDKIAIAALPTSIGSRESRHVDGLYTLTEEDVLWGKPFDDAIANGSYRVDVHYANRQGLVFRYQDGYEVYAGPDGDREGRWRDKTDDNPTYYQIPYRSLVPKGSRNVLVAGRLMDADRGAYGACRVMVNCNQTGEAAGVACAIALKHGISVAEVDPAELRKTMADGGSLVLTAPEVERIPFADDSQRAILESEEHEVVPA